MKKLCLFKGCKKLESVVIPDSISNIGGEVFCDCASLKSITIPQNVMTIGDMAFYGCDTLTSVTIPDGVLGLGELVFCDCDSLTSVSFPASVMSMGDELFLRCPALLNADVDVNNKVYKSDSGVLFTKDGKTLIHYPRGKTNSDYGVPDGVEIIDDYAFNECTNLVTVTLPKGLTDICDYAFSDCSGLKYMTLPEGLNNIGIHAFYECENLSSISIPDTVTSMGDDAFRICGLKKLTIPGSLTVTGWSSFAHCKGLTDVIICDGVEKIQEDTFYYCVNLKTVTIPKSVKIVGRYAFDNCDAITDVYYAGTEEDWKNIEFYSNSDEELLNAVIHYESAPASTPSVSGFVDRLYNILLGRSAEPEGLSDWTNKLSTGVSTSAEIVYGIAGSPEFNNRGLSNEEVVEKMYEAMLGRASDEGGKANWVNCLNSGMTVTGIVNGFSGSQEFANICAQYGIQAGAITSCEARDINNGLTLFVSRMYTKALGRPYDVSGLNDWTNRYITGTAKVSDIAYGFIFSQEFLSKGLNDSDYVDTLYRTFFDREPDNGGKSDWLGKLKNGSSREDVLNGFLGSQECKNLIASFNIIDKDEEAEKERLRIYNAMIALKEEYPDGTPWTNNNYYAWNGGIFSGGYGCVGFAFMLSDAAFGTLPARRHTDIDNIRVGDILRLNNDSHSVIILGIDGDKITLAEGNYNNAVKWGRTMTREQVNKTANYVMTRYPEE